MSPAKTSNGQDAKREDDDVLIVSVSTTVKPQGTLGRSPDAAPEVRAAPRGVLDIRVALRSLRSVPGEKVYNNEHGIQIHFPLALFKKLKGESLTLADLQDVNPKVWMSMQQMLAWQPTNPADANQEFEDTFCLSFSASYDYFGEHRDVDLKPGGADIPVTFDTRQEYVDLYCQWLLETSTERHFKLLAQGFEKVVDSALWSFLTAEEAHLIICCEPTLEASELRILAHYEGYDKDDPYIQDPTGILDATLCFGRCNEFWKILESFDIDHLKKFLSFTTGTDRAPLGGLKDVRLIVQKHGVEPTNRLPTAQTCFNLLLLPRYESAKKMDQSLLLAIENSEGFGTEEMACSFNDVYGVVAETYDDGSNGSWVLMSNCATLAAEATICEVGPDQGLISLQKYVVRMKEICTDAKLNSEFSYAASIATTWPMRAYPVSNITFTNIRDDAATISWLPGVAYERHVQECDFHHWEVMIRMASRYVQGGRAFGAISWDAEPPERDDLYLEYEEGTDWYLGCRSFTRDQSNCDPGSLESDRDYAVMVRERCLDSNADGDYVKSSSLLRTAAAAAHAPVNFTTSEIRKYRYDLSWDPGDRRACVFWAWQVMTKPVGVDWPPEEQDNASIAGGDHFFIYSRNITEARFKLPLGSNTQYGARVRERCTKPEFDGEWEYLLYPGVWTAPPVQAERLSNVTFLFNWPALLSIRFFAGPEGWLEDLDPGEEGYNSHSDCEFQGWYVEVADTSTPDSWLVQQECLVLPRSFEGCDIYSGLEYGKEYHLRLREGCTDPSARSPEYLTTVTARDRTPAAVPFDVKKNSDTAFSYEFSWEPGTSYDCVFLRWEVQLRSVNDTNSSAAAYGDGKIEDIRSRIYGHSQNPGGVSSADLGESAVSAAMIDDINASPFSSSYTLDPSAH
eukprot:s1624_g10.t1